MGRTRAGCRFSEHGCIVSKERLKAAGNEAALRSLTLSSRWRRGIPPEKMFQAAADFPKERRRRCWFRLGNVPAHAHLKLDCGSCVFINRDILSAVRIILETGGDDLIASRQSNR